jgi:two-component system, NtrC family, sensor kinase
MRQSEPEIAPEPLNDLGHLASGVGHHVINAFSAIVSNAELLRIRLGANSAPIDPAAIADMIIDTAMEAATVARRLIDFTRPITTIGDEQVRLHELVADYVEAARNAEREGTSWNSALERVPPILGNLGQLESMLDLFVANAREARIADKKMILSFATSIDSRGWVMLEIHDNGCGMAQSVLERAVEPFFSTKPGHLGVGLSIANGIWRRHRGTFSLLSHAGQGTTLRLCVEPC